MHEVVDNSAAARLLAVAHGTASAAGSATTRRLIDAVRAARPDVDVELCFLDVASPRLADVLAAGSPTGPPTVVVPLLLSTGYHVRTDIPAAVAGRRATVVARHLGPHPLLVDVLVERMSSDEKQNAETVLVGAGSSRDEARTELEATADLLAQRVGRPVDVLTMADDLALELRRRAAPVRVATYLLAEGRFTEELGRAAAGVAVAAAPLGVHPALVELVWSRFDDAVGRMPSSGVR